MRSRWSDDEAAGFVARYGAEWGEPLALRTYSSRLLGAEPDLVLHGGGNCSVKAPWKNVLGEDVEAIFVKASGADMATVEPAGPSRTGPRLPAPPAGADGPDDGAMVDQLRTHLLRADSPTPSIEALVHAFLPATFIDHTHADAILLLTNRDGGEAAVAEALGPGVIVIPYVTPGFKLALAAAEALEAQPEARAMVWAHHGIVTWGDTARASYEAMIELVSRAEEWAAARRAARARTGGAARRAARRSAKTCRPNRAPSPGASAAEIIPVVRGLLAGRTGDCDRPYDRAIIQILDDPDTLEALLAPGARETLVTPPLTTDHLIRTKSLPLWIDALRYDGPAHPAERVAAAVEAYCEEYEGYLARHAGDLPEGVETFDPRPRVVMIPGLGVICAGPDLRQAIITRDITKHTIAVKAALAAEGVAYQGLPEDELFRMEYRTLQHAKLGAGVRRRRRRGPTRRSERPRSAVRWPWSPVPPAPSAPASARGCCWRAPSSRPPTWPGEPLDVLVENLGAAFPGRIIGVPLDVTDPESVAAAFDRVVHAWGGVDLVIPNAGIAAVSPLIELDLDRYRLLERVNVEGTLLVLAEAARLFKRQGTGGDIVLVSTKNVFAPGANFGAYSSTKAAAHQLARIASLEFAARRRAGQHGGARRGLRPRRPAAPGCGPRWAPIA